jgi:hypothetical protein
MPLSVYVETSVIGYLTSRLRPDPIVAGQMLETRRWWAESRHAFDLITSDLVLEEASRGDSIAAAERLEALAGLPVLPITDAAGELGNALLVGHAMPSKARADALHLAICATNEIKCLATWNCRHLANVTLRPKIEEICKNAGYNAPLICTPPQLNEVRL